MELRPQEDDPEEQGHKTDTLTVANHVLIKTKLKMDWLQGQVDYPSGSAQFAPGDRRILAVLE